MQHGRKLPAEVTRIGNPGVHAVAACRDVLMRGIASEKHPAKVIALSEQKMRRPGTCEQGFVIEVATGEVTEHYDGIDRRRRDVLRKSCLERPNVAVVLRDQRALVRLVVPRHAKMLEHVMGRGAKVDQEPVHHSRLTMQSDAETMPDPAAAAIAADE